MNVGRIASTWVSGRACGLQDISALRIGFQPASKAPVPVGPIRRLCPNRTRIDAAIVGVVEVEGHPRHWGFAIRFQDAPPNLEPRSGMGFRRRNDKLGTKVVRRFKDRSPLRRRAILGQNQKSENRAHTRYTGGLGGSFLSLG